MFQQLDYQECYHKVAHESVINAMVLSPDGRRLITGSGDSTVLMWSTQSGSEFSLENEVFKPFFCGQTVGKYVTFVAAVAVAGRISLWPLPCCII